MVVAVAWCCVLSPPYLTEHTPPPQGVLSSLILTEEETEAQQSEGTCWWHTPGTGGGQNLN